MAKDTASWEQYHIDLQEKGLRLEWPDEFVIRFCKGELIPNQARRVIEVGCGPGRHVHYLRLMGLQVVGTDIARSAIEQARAWLEHDHLMEGTELVVADATSLPFPDQSFDGALAWRFLHVLDPAGAQKCVDELYRLVRPGGRVLLGTRSPRSSDYEAIAAGRTADPDFDYQPGQLSERGVQTTYFHREDLERLFRRFENVTIEHMEWTRKNGTFREAYWSVTATRP